MRRSPHPSLERIVARFELSPHLYPAIALLYGAHLAGEPGVAPVDVARVLEPQLGRGARHAASSPRRWSRCFATRASGSRPRCNARSTAARRAPARWSAQPGAVALLGPCVVVAPDDGPLGLVAEASCRPRAARSWPPSARDPLELVLEARAHGAVPMLRATSTTVIAAHKYHRDLRDRDEAVAEQLDLPRL